MQESVGGELMRDGIICPCSNLLKQWWVGKGTVPYTSQGNPIFKPFYMRFRWAKAQILVTAVCQRDVVPPIDVTEQIALSVQSLSRLGLFSLSSYSSFFRSAGLKEYQVVVQENLKKRWAEIQIRASVGEWMDVATQVREKQKEGWKRRVTLYDGRGAMDRKLQGLTHISSIASPSC